VAAAVTAVAAAVAAVPAAVPAAAAAVVAAVAAAVVAPIADVRSGQRGACAPLAFFSARLAERLAVQRERMVGATELRLSRVPMRSALPQHPGGGAEEAR
jgi:hypothetical protein